LFIRAVFRLGIGGLWRLKSDRIILCQQASRDRSTRAIFPALDCFASDFQFHRAISVVDSHRSTFQIASDPIGFGVSLVVVVAWADPIAQRKKKKLLSSVCARGRRLLLSCASIGPGLERRPPGVLLAIPWRPYWAGPSAARPGDRGNRPDPIEGNKTSAPARSRGSLARHAEPQTISAVKRAAFSALCSVSQFCVAEDREKQLELIAYLHTIQRVRKGCSSLQIFA
jgi:hypothetical protein